jgi:hypothetical protein
MTVNKWLIVNTLNNIVATRTLGDILVDAETINMGNLSVTARCYLGDSANSLLLKCYLTRDVRREKIYGSMYYRDELAVFMPNGRVQYVDIAISHWVEGRALSDYILQPNSNFARLSRNFDTMAYSLLLDDMVHCDIKPENIIVDEELRMTLVDNDALWCDAWGRYRSHEKGTFGYRGLKSEAHTPVTYMQNYPIVLISIILAALSWEYDTIRPYVQEGLLFNPEDERHFAAAIEAAKMVFKRAGDESHYKLCEEITPMGVSTLHLTEKMYCAAFVPAASDRPMSLMPYYDV